MKIYRKLVGVGALFLLVTVSASALDAVDIGQMLANNVPESAIANMAQTQKLDSPLTTQDIISIKNAGASNALLEILTNSANINSSWQPPVVQSPAPVVVESAPRVVQSSPVVIESAPTYVTAAPVVVPAPVVYTRPYYYGYGYPYYGRPYYGNSFSASFFFGSGGGKYYGGGGRYYGGGYRGGPRGGPSRGGPRGHR